MSGGSGRRPWSTLVGQAVTYGWTNALVLAIPIVLAPILSFYLTPEDYAVVAVFGIVLGLAAPLVGLGVQSAIRRRYFEADVDLAAYLSSCLGGNLAGLLFVMAVALATTPLWNPDGTLPLVWILLFAPWLATRQLLSLASSFLQLEGRALARGTLQSAAALSDLALSLLLVAGFGLGWQGRVAGEVGASCLLGVVAAVWLWRRFPRRPAPSARLLRDALRYGVPTVPFTLVDRIVAVTDRGLVIAVLGLAVGGTYVLASQLAGVVTLVVASFLLAWEPWVYTRLSDGSEAGRRSVVKAVYWSAALLALAVLGLNLAAPLVLPAVVSERYLGGLELLPWLTVAFGFRGLSHILARVILFRGQNAVLSHMALVLALLNILGNLVLIPLHGALGAAQATCGVFALGAGLTWFAARRAVALPWRLRPAASGLGSAAPPAAR